MAYMQCIGVVLVLLVSCGTQVHAGKPSAARERPVVDTASEAARFVEQITLSNAGVLTWEQLQPGMDRKTVERILGAKLDLKPSATTGAYTHQVIVRRGGLDVRLWVYQEGGLSVLTEISPVGAARLQETQALTLRTALRQRLKGLRDSGIDFPLVSTAGTEIDVRKAVLRLQLGSESE